MKKFLALLVLVAAAVLIWRWQSAPAPLSADVPQGQLPDTATPLSYTLALDVDPARDQFSGHVEIRTQLNAPAKQLWLHGRGLEMRDAAVVTVDGLRVPARWQEQGESGVVLLSFDRELPAQTLTLVFDYQAAFGETLTGLYKVEDGDLPYAFTQMEAVHAREAFPSFDEPRFKVPFDVSLTVRADHQAIANTPLANSETLADGRKKLTFATSKPLPTYLLAWAVGELDVVEWAAIPASELRSHSIPLRGVATKGKGAKMNYALENTAAILGALEQYFGTPYPYEKLDIIAVPDFEAGAMENAGAITYREQLLLIDEHASLDAKRSYASVHAHELAHQWFGNLVTMPWWTDLWLNEAFASWMENKIVMAWAPQMGFELSYQKDARSAMQPDSLATMREIRQPINNNADIDNAFDGITYAKGSAVIAMFENFVGAEVFQRGVQAYMQKHAWGNATSEDFIAAVSEAAGDARLPAAFMSFLTQTGIPEVSVDWQCADNQVSATLKQQRYRPIGSQAKSDQRWQLPLCVSTVAQAGGSSEKHCTLLADAEQQWQFAVAQCPAQIVPNAAGSGYYRFRLGAEQWPALIGSLAQLPVTEAFVVADNFSAALRAGTVDVNQYLAQVPTIVSHPHRDVLTQPMGTLGFIDEYLIAASDRPKLQRFYSALYTPRFTALGLQPKAGESDDDVLLRNTLLDFLVDTARDESLRAPLRDMGKAYVGFGGDEKLHQDAVHPELAGTALVVASQDIGEPFFRALEKQLDNTDDGTVRNYLITALARSTDPKLAEEARGMVTGLGLRTNERIGILYNQMQDVGNAEALYEWFKGKYSLLRPLLPEGVQKRAPMIGMRFCSEAQAKSVSEFFAPKMAELPGAQQSLDNTLEQINLCAALVKAQPAVNWEVLATP